MQKRLNHWLGPEEQRQVEPVAIILLIIGIFLITQRWFWLLVFGIGGLAAAFATLASIFHFQILGALGFFFLMLICRGIAGAIADA
ncbi:hypothetical protein [Anthocerotibacter panamensis]|uniref:hypothetical protein n=1 Tax=Anthocerotibacter panamensis TaxID=2857077 RepID=UPI001C40802C|nr:hypothetical protein [Anthocerotibacter panamensis]